MVGRRPRRSGRGGSRRSATATLSTWRRRLRWLRRALVLASLVASARKALGPSGSTAGGSSSGGAGRPAPTGGPSPRPRLPAARAEPGATATEDAGESVTTTVVTLDRVRITETTESATATTPDPDTEWVEGGDGQTVPDGFPIKVNTRSGIYHAPGGRMYDRTRADRWYRSTEAAEADGFRASKMT